MIDLIDYDEASKAGYAYCLSCKRYIHFDFTTKKNVVIDNNLHKGRIVCPFCKGVSGK